jgi:hypothetical protein
MQNNHRMILVGIVCLIIGGFFGYLLCSSSSFEADTYSLSWSENKNSKPLTREEARDMIMKLRKKKRYRMVTGSSWKIEKETLVAVLGQTSMFSDSVDAIQFYPAIGKDGGLTLVLVGRVKDRLVLRQVKRDSRGNSIDDIGEFRDYIGPCPPHTGCPVKEDEIALLTYNINGEVPEKK